MKRLIVCFIFSTAMCASAQTSTSPTQTEALPDASKTFQAEKIVSPPVIFYSQEAVYPERARNMKFKGEVQIQVLVDEKGDPQQLRVMRDPGMGLAQSALAAVRGYKFKPARNQAGQAVPCRIIVAVDFNISSR